LRWHRRGGLLVGNGVADHRLDFDSIVTYAYSHALVPLALYEVGRVCRCESGTNVHHERCFAGLRKDPRVPLALSEEGLRSFMPRARQRRQPSRHTHEGGEETRCGALRSIIAPSSSTTANMCGA
jgi:hypothetical protein